MFLFKNIKALRIFLDAQTSNGKTTGFVPTMGALHEGHLSLIRKSRSQGHLTVCSIFINPTQFNQREDFEKYPRQTLPDLKLLLGAGCDVLFHPDPPEMYPDGFSTGSYDFGNITAGLEGLHRPGHFDGVITIVKKLFEAVQPGHAYFGQKDFQQCAVVRHLIAHFGMPVELHVEPVVRESSGLAMSSRNARLSETEKQDALVIYEALRMIRKNKDAYPAEKLKDMAAEIIGSKLKVEYVEIADPVSLEPVADAGSGDAVALVAAWCGNVRLIDNLLLNDSR